VEQYKARISFAALQPTKSARFPRHAGHKSEDQDHMQLLIRYVAVLRDERGQAEESLETGAATPRALYHELSARHGFSLPDTRLQVAVNDEFAAWDQPLRDGDQLVFLPPVAGG